MVSDGVDGPVDRVGDDDRIRDEPVAVGLEEPRERRRAILLLALHEQGDPDRRSALVHPKGGDVRHDAGLVVGGTPAVEAPSRSVGSNGGLVHSVTSPVGWTSWWA